MFEKLLSLEDKFNEINEKLMQPEVVNDSRLYTELMKEYKTLEPIAQTFGEYKKAKEQFEEAQELLDAGGLDKDFKEMVQAQYEESKDEMSELEGKLKIMLLPKDPNDEKNVIIEIRGGAGGEEAALFAGSLFRMYTMYAEARGTRDMLALCTFEHFGNPASAMAGTDRSAWILGRWKHPFRIHCFSVLFQHIQY